MDNLSHHKRAAIRLALEARRARLSYLPPRFPDLNPIERAFARLKALLRKAAARTASAPWDVIGELLDRFSPADCANDLANAGYGRST
jgi:transposase